MRTVLFDATRLFMRASLGSPTGIDRVTEAYARWLLARPDVDLIPVCTLGGLVSPMSRTWFERVMAVRPSRPAGGADWPRLLAALAADAPGREALRARPERTALAGPVPRYVAFGARALTRWRPATPPSGALFVNVSHYGLEQPGLLERLSRRGVRTVAMVHDLIPLTHPEYCSPPAARWHRRRIETLLRHRARVLANSAATAADLTAFARAHDLPTPEVRVAPLGLEPAFLAPGEIGSVGGRPYFVCVGTLEPRKNLAFLLTLWRRLAETLGEATPPLVLAGRRGWENEAIIDLLERADTVRRFVHEVPGLNDEQLARLIAGARALLAPSFAEGFNLPVAEAAALGVNVIASDIPVHRELAAGARLIDPLDGAAWLAAIAAAALDLGRPAPRAPFSWVDHFAITAEVMEL